MVKLNKGELAPHTGALIPFGTFRRYEEFRQNYEWLRDQYEHQGTTEETFVSGIRKDALLFIIFATSGVLAGALVSGADNSVKNIVYGASFIGLAGSLVILTF